MNAKVLLLIVLIFGATFGLAYYQLHPSTSTAERVQKAHDEARTIVNRAIEAQGGEDKVARLRSYRAKTTGTIRLDIAFLNAPLRNVDPIPFTAELYVETPGRFKSLFRCELGGESFLITSVLDGDQGWLSVNGRTVSFGSGSHEVTLLKEEMRIDRIPDLLPLIKNPAFQLAALGESTITDRTVSNLQVKSPGYRDVRLYFDKADGLLYKVESVLEDGTALHQFIKEYQVINGLKVPKYFLLKRDGITFVKALVTELKPVKQFKDSTFGPP